MENSILMHVLAWTCAVVFVAISIITVLALIGKVKFPDERYLRRLFYVLIVEVVGVGVFAFKLSVTPSSNDCEDCPDYGSVRVDTVYESTSEEMCIIYYPQDTLWYLPSWENFFLEAVYQSSSATPNVEINFKVDKGNWQIVDSSNIILKDGKLSALMVHMPDSLETIYVRTILNDVKQPIHKFVLVRTE